MNNLTRSDYLIIKDFEHAMILPISKVPVKYKKGERLNLRVNGKMTKEFLEKGYIKKINS